MNKLLGFIGLAIPTVLFAGPGQTSAPIGTDYYLTMGGSSAADLVVNGGRFNGSLSSTQITSANTGALVNLWCVDAQLYFNWNGVYRANSLGFEEINGEGTTFPGQSQVGPGQTSWADGYRDVRYEDVQRPGVITSGPNFSINTNGATNYDPAGTAAGEEALFRYRMAGYLLDQYTSVATYTSDQTTVFVKGDGLYGIGKYTPTNTTNGRNQAIIKAIWSAMDTDTDTGGSNDQPALAGDVQTWFDRAALYVSTNWNTQAAITEWSKWVVVSGWDSNNYVKNSGGPVQTFLTERPPSLTDVPEPGFYGLLATGISGLFWFAARRRKDNTQA